MRAGRDAAIASGRIGASTRRGIPCRVHRHSRDIRYIRYIRYIRHTGPSFDRRLRPDLKLDLLHVVKLSRPDRPEKNAPRGERNEKRYEKEVEGDVHS